MRLVDVGFRRIQLLAQTLLFGIVLAPGVRAQGNQGILAGTVVDSTGALVDGATITARNLATGRANSTVAAAGTFRIPSLLVGKYDVTATMTGFQTVTQAGIDVLVSTTTPVNFTLALSAVAESVVVTAGGTTIASESSDVGTVIETRQVVELPLALGGVGALRSPEAFMFLAPGVTGPGTANSNNGIFISKIGGGQNFGNEVLLDGASTLRAENGSSFDEAGPSVEAIREFKVLDLNLPGRIRPYNRRCRKFHDEVRQKHVSRNGVSRSCRTRHSTRTSGSTTRSAQRDPSIKRMTMASIWAVPSGFPRSTTVRTKRFSSSIGNSTVKIRAIPRRVRCSRMRCAMADLSAYLTNRQLGTNACNGTPIFEGQVFDPATTQAGLAECSAEQHSPATKFRRIVSRTSLRIF